MPGSRSRSSRRKRPGIRWCLSARWRWLRPRLRAWPRLSSAPASISASGARTTSCACGTTRTIPKYCFVLEVAAPGLLVVKHSSGKESGKFVNVTVLEGDQIKMVDEHAASTPECPAPLMSLPGLGLVHFLGRLRQLAGATGRLHARARARRVSSGGSGGQRILARIHCGAAGLCRFAALFGPGPVEPGAARGGRDASRCRRKWPGQSTGSPA